MFCCFWVVVFGVLLFAVGCVFLVFCVVVGVRVVLFFGEFFCWGCCLCCLCVWCVGGDFLVCLFFGCLFVGCFWCGLGGLFLVFFFFVFVVLVCVFLMGWWVVLVVWWCLVFVGWGCLVLCLVWCCGCVVGGFFVFFIVYGWLGFWGFLVWGGLLCLAWFGGCVLFVVGFLCNFGWLLYLVGCCCRCFVLVGVWF